MSGVFFNGRHMVTPSTVSQVDDSAMRNKNLTVGNAIVFIGESLGGSASQVMKFGSPSDARAVLRGGSLLEAVERAFDPSPQTYSPSTVLAIRVNPATNSTLVLANGAGAAINLISVDAGLWTNQIMVKVGSNRLTVKQAGDYYDSDDLTHDAFDLHYSGAEASATVDVTGTTVVLSAPAGTAVATMQLAEFNTVQKLVDKMNTVPGFAATVIGGNASHATLNALDYAAAVAVPTGVAVPVKMTATLNAMIDWLTSRTGGLVVATRATGAGAVPIATAWVPMAGGTDGVPTAQDWADAFEAAQAEDVQWVVPLTADASIHAQAVSHCVYMSNVARSERRCLVGGGIGQTVAGAITAAKLLNSDRASYCYPGFWDYNSDGIMTLYPAYLTAALVAAAFSGSNPGTSMTNKSIRVRGLELKLLNPTETDDLIDGGVLCIEETRTGFKVVKSVSTWLENDNYNRVEVSTGVAVDYTIRTVRNALDSLRGEKGSPVSIAEAASRVETALMELSRAEPIGIGVLAGDADNPPFRNIAVSLDGDVLRVEFQCSPVIPINYILVTLHAVPYSGTVKV